MTFINSTRDLQNILDEAKGIARPQTFLNLEETLKDDLRRIKSLDEFKDLDIQFNKMAISPAYYVAKYSENITPELLELLLDWLGGLEGLLDRETDSELYKNRVFETASQHAGEDAGLAKMERAKDAVKVLTRLANEGWASTGQLEELIERAKFEGSDGRLSYSDWMFEVAQRAENLNGEQLLRLVQSQGAAERLFSHWPYLAGHRMAMGEIWKLMLGLAQKGAKNMDVTIWTEIMQHDKAWENEVWLDKLRQEKDSVKREVAMALIGDKKASMRGEWDVDELLEWLAGTGGREEYVVRVILSMKSSVKERIGKRGKAALLGSPNREVRVAAMQVFGQVPAAPSPDSPSGRP